MLDVWPDALLPANKIAWRRRNVTSVTTSIGGIVRPALTDGGGLWTLELGDITLWDAPKIKLARALSHRMASGAAPIIVNSCERGFAPLLTLAMSGGEPHSDTTPFDDGGLYESGAIDIKARAAPLRATSLTVRLFASAPLQGGEAFAIYHAPPLGFEDGGAEPGKRRYEIHRVDAPVAGYQTIGIWPPLRAAIDDDAVLDFDSVGCAMTLQNAEAFFDAIDLGRFSGLNPVFQEAF